MHEIGHPGMASQDEEAKDELCKYRFSTCVHHTDSGKNGQTVVCLPLGPPLPGKLTPAVIATDQRELNGY